ncbi:hypothetical protein ACIQ9R_37565 [Streptomyces sp. NPDC094447]|uniref:hypothetical protein n=1 Tax=Streptomyces sp. NPDC094447 TaxID=3366062 RepID=UPI003824E122
MARTWSAVLARLGVPTGDGRIIDPAGGASRDLPLPLMFQQKSEDGHGGSQVVGRIETLRIADGMVTATGSMLDAAYGTDVIELLEAGVVGPSVDLDDIEYVMDEAENLIITRWRVAGATLVSIPAFADVSLTLDPLPAEPMPDLTELQDIPVEEWLYASAAPQQLPPADWFQRPDVDQLTPLVVTDTGRVFGHIAGWDTCHVGLPGCVTPPSSPTGYTYFHVAEQRTQDGATLPVGTLVAGPRHADAQLAFRAAQEHYDDPAAAVARVVAGEDEHGIWVAGWLLPGATPEALDVFRSSPVSGDWRRVGGSLELIGVCSVNTPGFPVPRARVHFAAGHQRALIGSFGITPTEQHVHKLGNPDEDGGILDDWDNCRDPNCPGPTNNELDIARARLRWALATTNQEA